MQSIFSITSLCLISTLSRILFPFVHLFSKRQALLVDMLTNKGVSVLSSPRGCVQSQIGFDLDFLDLDLFDFHPSFNLEPFDLPPFDLATSQLIGPASGQHIENTEEPGEHNGIHAPARMSRIRKRKAPSIEDKDWERMKSRVIGLYCIENRPLKEVRDTIMQEFGFNATYATLSLD